MRYVSFWVLMAGIISLSISSWAGSSGGSTSSLSGRMNVSIPAWHAPLANNSALGWSKVTASPTPNSIGSANPYSDTGCRKTYAYQQDFQYSKCNCSSGFAVGKGPSFTGTIVGVPFTGTQFTYFCT